MHREPGTAWNRRGTSRSKTQKMIEIRGKISVMELWKCGSIDIRDYFDGAENGKKERIDDDRIIFKRKCGLRKTVWNFIRVSAPRTCRAA